jgi:DNA-binding response OmpR family regulator
MHPFLASLSYHILVVENELDLYELIRTALECDGFQIKFRAKKNDGDTVALFSKIDLVLVDVGLPDGLRTEVAQYAASLKIPGI